MKKINWALAIIPLLLLVSACAQVMSPPEQPTYIPRPTATDLPTRTPRPTITPTATATGTPTALPTPSAPQVAYISNGRGSWDIYRANLDGTNQTQLTSLEGDERAPAWSPDGMKLLFQAKIDGLWQIMLMNWDGTDQIQLTTNGNNQNPVFSPEGGRILFDSDRAGSRDIYQMSADGSNQKGLVFRRGNQFHPIWSPDGSTIAYLSDENTSPELCVQSADGKCPQEVFFMTAEGQYLRKIEGLKRLIDDITWAPDGKTLAIVAPYFPLSEIVIYDTQTLKFHSFLNLAMLLDIIYRGGVGNLHLHSFSYSPRGSNGIFCGYQQQKGASGPRPVYSGCYMLGIEDIVIYTIIREENQVKSDADLGSMLDFADAVWRP